MEFCMELGGHVEDVFIKKDSVKATCILPDKELQVAIGSEGIMLSSGKAAYTLWGREPELKCKEMSDLESSRIHGENYVTGKAVAKRLLFKISDKGESMDIL